MNILRKAYNSIKSLYRFVVLVIANLPGIILCNYKIFWEKFRGKKIIAFDICSYGQLQFIEPIVRKLGQSGNACSCYLFCNYSITDKKIEIGISKNKIFLSQTAFLCFGIDVFLQTEIYGRGPLTSKRIFIGHGQPNKWTYWSVENLNSFEYYFLYGRLERDMFAVIMNDNHDATKHIKLMDIGYPKLDDQINARYDSRKIFNRLGLNPDYKTVIYAPAWDPGCSLRTSGIEIVRRLLAIENINVIVKLHPVSMEPETSPNYIFFTGGVNWPKEFSQFENNPRFRFVNDYLVNPILFISDIMLTDFSGVALEFMTLNRPVIYLDCPEFYERTLKDWNCDPVVAKNDERFNAGRNAGLVIDDLKELPQAVRRSLENPKEFSEKRDKLTKKFLYNPGKGSEATVNAIYWLLNKKQA